MFAAECGDPKFSSEGIAFYAPRPNEEGVFPVYQKQNEDGQFEYSFDSGNQIAFYAFKESKYGIPIYHLTQMKQC
jgi:hypothetical protein